MQRIPLNELTFWLMRYGSKQANMNLYKSESSFKGAIRMAENLPSTEMMVDELKEWDKKYFIHPTTSPGIHVKEGLPIIFKEGRGEQSLYIGLLKQCLLAAKARDFFCGLNRNTTFSLYKLVLSQLYS